MSSSRSITTEDNQPPPVSQAASLAQSDGGNGIGVTGSRVAPKTGWPDEQRVRAVRNYAKSLIAAGKPGEALKMLTSILRHSDNSELWNDWACAAFACGDSALAESGYRRALTLDPSCQYAAINLAALLLRQRRFAESMPVLQSLQGRLTDVQKAGLRQLIVRSQPEVNAAVPSAAVFQSSISETCLPTQPAGKTINSPTAPFSPLAVVPGKHNERRLKSQPDEFPAKSALRLQTEGPMTLREIFKNLERGCDKFEHYFPLYEKWFGKFVGKAPKVLEIGVQFGGSAEMWAKYFGPGTMVHGVDISPLCEETDYLKLTVGDQGSQEFWESFLARHPDGFDIVMDDGSHDNPHQILTLAMTYRLVRNGGIYWCEDTHTSYYHNVRVVDGGYQNPRSFTEFTKRLIDVVNAHHTYFAIGVGATPNSPHVNLNLVKMFHEIQGIHFYDSIVVIEKGPRLDCTRCAPRQSRASSR